MMETTPHPHWAQYAERMRCTGNRQHTEQYMRSRAQEQCPQGMGYDIRWLGDYCEWFAPESPNAVMRWNQWTKTP